MRNPARTLSRYTVPGSGPDFWTVDARLSKSVPIGDRVSVEFIAEAFNLFNRLNFGSVNNTVGVMAPPFDLTGRSDRSPSEPLGFTSAFDTREIQLGFRVNFWIGGCRVRTIDEERALYWPDRWSLAGLGRDAAAIVRGR